MEIRPFDRIDLTKVLPALSIDEAARIRRAAARIDLSAPAPGRSGWTWFPDRVTYTESGERWVVFGIAFSYASGPQRDGVEFDLSVIREQPPSLAVEISTDIDCWCETDHRYHTIRSQSWLVGTPESFIQAFESATATLAQWITGSHTAADYRVTTGLPSPSVTLGSGSQN
ncbi:hypothetical protein [Nocardia sp. NPDC056100]|uniref:hypothetical protein n=1 Tax=Nocardia sp. NPDC056100 TaxID=3345712 RepID=UPI0035E11799